MRVRLLAAGLPAAAVSTLYGSFQGPTGLNQAQPGRFPQVDRDGDVLKELPPVWGGLTPPGATLPFGQAEPPICRIGHSQSTIRGDTTGPWTS